MPKNGTCREQFRVVFRWGKAADWPQVLGQRLGNEPWPIAADFARHVKIQIACVDFFERHRANLVANQFRKCAFCGHALITI